MNRARPLAARLKKNKLQVNQEPRPRPQAARLKKKE